MEIYIKDSGEEVFERTATTTQKDIESFKRG